MATKRGAKRKMSDYGGHKQPPKGGERSGPSDPWEGHAKDDITTLQLVDKLLADTPAGESARFDLFRLRQQIQDDEVTLTEARAALEKMGDVIKKVTSPANRIGTFLGLPNSDVAHIAVGGHDYYANVDPRLDHKSLHIGTRVLVNEAYVVVGDLGYDYSGPVGKITDTLKDGRLRVGQEHGLQSVILQRSSNLSATSLKVGDEVRIDPSFRVALELLSSSNKQEFYLEEVPQLHWSSVGGQQEAIHAIKDAIELPLIHQNLFQRFHYAQPKGFLLHGPPGCGKTLIGKATAYNLTRNLSEKTGRNMQECFLHVKGPEILNMWVGESERIVREIFSIARDKRRQGFMPFLFIDEAESVLGTRRAGRYSNILSTLVPMFCSEMDGIESLHDVVIILASNRADLIDPAILRPGRIDRKIKVHRPDKEGSREIFSIYISGDLPLDESTLKIHNNDHKAAASALIETVLENLFSRRAENRFLEVQTRSGKKEILYRSDLITGAIIASIAERAKEIAIKRSIKTGNDEGIGESDLLCAARMEFGENDIFPPTDITEDWLHLLDYDPENVVKVSPIRPETKVRTKGVSQVA